MSDNDWKKGFNKALIDAIIREGSPLREESKRDFYSGYLDWEWRKTNARVFDVGIDYDKSGPPERSEWNEFMGTFYEGDTRKVGLDVRVVLLNGTYVDYRYDGNISDLILAVTRD